ncbi:MAG TPA: extracellular solute-binding protein [Candidatus Spyradocola merdavium]|nr:extracellular solute-binding protein [Candidatus Spyradocola merdavium]
MKTRLFALALVLILALGCVACSAPAQAPEEAVDPTAQSPEAPAAETDSAFAEHVTFTMNTTSDPPAEDDALWNYYTDKFNFTVDWVPLQYAERFDKLRIWIATDDLPDVVWIGLNDVIYSEYITWMNSGMFAEVPSLDAYPNIQAMYNQEAMLGDELCTFDGKLMSLPAMRDSASYDFMINMGIGYRADWAEKLGMRNEGDVYTWDEFMNLLQAFIEQDPGGNGAGNTYGLCTRMGYFPDILGIWQTNPTPWTFEEPGYIEMDGQYVWYPSTDAYIEGLKIVKDLYDRGIIWPDNVIDSSETLYRELYVAGQMGAMAQNLSLGFVSQVRDDMIKVDPSLERDKVYAIARISNPGTEDEFYQHAVASYWSCVAFSLKATDAQKDRFLATQDWNLSPEGLNLGLYGLEGTDFTVNDDGSINLLWEKDEAGTYVDPYPFREYYTRLSVYDNAANFTNVSKNPQDVEDVRSAMDWSVENIGDKVKVLDYVQTYTTTPNKDKLGTFTAQTKAKVIDLLANSTGDTIEADWRAWIAEMMPQVQPVLDDLNAYEYIPTDPDEMMEWVRNGGLAESR